MLAQAFAPLCSQTSSSGLLHGRIASSGRLSIRGSSCMQRVYQHRLRGDAETPGWLHETFDSAIEFIEHHHSGSLAGSIRFRAFPGQHHRFFMLRGRNTNVFHIPPIYRYSVKAKLHIVRRDWPRLRAWLAPGRKLNRPRNQPG